MGFYRELLTLGFNVFACDADAIFMGDPRPLMRQEPWVHAEVAIATDCIDLPGDARRPLLHCDFNTGLVFMRGSSQGVLDFTEQVGGLDPPRTLPPCPSIAFADHPSCTLSRIHAPANLHPISIQSPPNLHPPLSQKCPCQSLPFADRC